MEKGGSSYFFLILCYLPYQFLDWLMLQRSIRVSFYPRSHKSTSQTSKQASLFSVQSQATCKEPAKNSLMIKIARCVRGRIGNKMMGQRGREGRGVITIQKSCPQVLYKDQGWMVVWNFRVLTNLVRGGSRKFSKGGVISQIL